MLKNLYNKFWDWCKNSGTILNARLTMFGGILLGTLGSLDWSSLLSYSIQTTYNWKNAVILGATVFAQGLVTELVRKNNTVEVDNKLLPAEATKTQIKAIEVKK